MKDCACSVPHRNRDRACASDDHAKGHFLAPDDRVDALLPANARFPQTQCSCRFTATQMHAAMNRARARRAISGINVNACIDIAESARSRRKKRCVDATTRTKFCATNTSARDRYDFDMRIDTSHSRDTCTRRDARVSVKREDSRTNTHASICASTCRKSRAAHRAEPDVPIGSTARLPCIVMSQVRHSGCRMASRGRR